MSNIDWVKIRASVRTGATKAAKVLGKAQGFAAVAAAASAKPTILGVTGVAVSALHLMSEALKGEGGERFRSWHVVTLPQGCERFAWAILRDSFVGNDGTWNTGKVDGQSFAAYSTHYSDGTSIYYFRAERDPMALSEHVRSRSLALVGAHGSIAGDGSLTREAEPEEMPSDLADAVWRRIAPPIAAGHTRVVMLAGPPGTGKSTIARTLTRRLCDTRPGATTLRVAVSDLRDLRPSHVDGLLGLLRTDVLLLDDLDRFAAPDQLLDLFEHCHGRQRLVIATVNDESRLPGALRRPGRIDEVVRVEGVGEALARRILGPVASRMTEEQIRVMSGWPAAHVSEVALRLNTIPGACAAAEIADVGSRVGVQS